MQPLPPWNHPQTCRFKEFRPSERTICSAISAFRRSNSCEERTSSPPISGQIGSGLLLELHGFTTEGCRRLFIHTLRLFIRVLFECIRRSWVYHRKLGTCQEMSGMHHCSTLSKGRSSHLNCLNVWISNVGHLTRCIDEVKRVETMPVFTRANVKQTDLNQARSGDSGWFGSIFHTLPNDRRTPPWLFNIFQRSTNLQGIFRTSPCLLWRLCFSAGLSSPAWPRAGTVFKLEVWPSQMLWYTGWSETCRSDGLIRAALGWPLSWWTLCHYVTMSLCHYVLLTSRNGIKQKDLQSTD